MPVDVARDVRTQYAALIDLLSATGEMGHAKACAAMAARHGVWKDPLQRPTSFDPQLPNTPIYDASRFWFTGYLEGQYPVIRDEVARVIERRRDCFSLVDEPLVGAGSWTEAVLYENGLRMDGPCAAFPKTAAIMSQVPEAMQSGGVIMLSWLAPGTHIVPHCGATNTKLRVHMGIQIPAGASMRVGDQRIVWQEGTCVVFDDSYEHEVWNPTTDPRIVLLFDVVHPDLAHAPRGNAEAAADLESVVTKFLTARGIVGVERDPATDELTLMPDEPTARTITRYMKDLSVTRVQMTGGALVIE